MMVGVGKVTTGEQFPAEALTVMLAGQATARRSISFTVTVKKQVAVAPPPSVATQLTGVAPIGKLEPLGGVHTMLKIGQLSTTGMEKFTAAEQAPGSFTVVMFTGQVIRGAGLTAIVVAVDMLFSGLLSGVDALKTDAVLLMKAPAAAEQLTRATIIISAGVFGASDAKVIVRVLPDPPQTPPPVELQETKVRLLESTSVTVTEMAVAGPALLTVILLVTSEPVSGAGVILVSTDKSAGVPPATLPSWMLFENSDVLPVGLVAVAVTTCPGKTVAGTVWSKFALPVASVVTEAAPRKFCPSPKPDGLLT
jgi:hypothetical protein